jgi:hypothetical protein
MQRRTSAVAVLLALVAAPLSALVLGAGPAAAATFGPVDPTIPDGNANSLRDVLHNQVASGDTVLLQPGATYTLTNCGGASGDVVVKAAVTIDGGSGATIRQTCPSGGILVDSFNLTVHGVTFTGGNRNNGDGGGAIAIEGGAGRTVQVSSSTFVGNATPSDSGNDGGAILIDAQNTSLQISNSTFANNVADDDGGAIDCNFGPSSITAAGTTFSGNSTRPGAGDSGGAIDMESDNCHLTLVNSTVTTNTSGDDAALTGEFTGDSITLVYSSVVNNATNPATPGVQAQRHDKSVHPQNDVIPVATANVEIHDPPLFSVFGTFIAHPHGGPNCSNAGSLGVPATPLTATVTSGYNLSDDTSCGLTAATDKEGAGNDPGVGPLANNGGPTQTVLPQAGSLLLDAIPAAACQADGAAGVTTDQRGITRPQGPGCDIGAVEVVEPVPLVVQPRFTG